MGKRAFDICDMSPIIFRVGTISPQEPVLFAFTPFGEGGAVEILMMSRALCGGFVFDRDLLTVGSFWANVTFFD